MDKEQGHAAKIRLVTLMRQGQPWQVAAATAGVQTSQSTAYRLLQVYHSRGEVALQDGRHGHPSKLRGEARTFLADYRRGAPHTASSVIQTLLQERFDLSVSVSQINRIRAALGVSNSSHARQQEKKRE